MPSSSMCPCDACFNAPYPTQQEIAARTQVQRKSIVLHLPTRLPTFLSRRRGGGGGGLLRFQKAPSIASSTTSSLVGLKGAAQPIAIVE